MGTTGTALVSVALSYKGCKYKWGGWLPAGWDCSGFVNYVLGKQLGQTLPGGIKWPGSWHGPVAAQYRIWTGAVTVTTPQPGDLCCWQTHVGIYIGNGEMISALSKEHGTRISPVSWGPKGQTVSYRRIKTLEYVAPSGAGYATAAPAGAGCAMHMLALPVLVPFLLIRRAVQWRPAREAA